MDPVRLSGPEFVAVLEAGEAFEAIVGLECGAVLVEGDELPDLMAPELVDRVAMVPAVVVGVVSDPAGRRPAWADLVVAPASTEFTVALETVAANPLASIALAVLLRGSEHRTVAQGLVAESMAYGLLQAGPEFAAWRHGAPARPRPDGEGPPVLVDRRAHELSVTLHRPHVHNAFNAPMRDELVAALQVAVADPSVTAVVVRGAGDSFCSGGDLDEFGSRSDPATAHLVRMQRSAGRVLDDLSDRTTVHIHGSTVGSGIELAAFAHRVVAHRSTRISLPEVHLGLIPGAGGTVSLPHRIGRHATLLLALALPWIDAPTALSWGLVDGLEGCT
jgi:Enoyl-CoA hydratase/isomerase